MEVLVVWVIFAAVVGYIASQRGRSGGGFFVLSLLLSPLIGIVVLLATGTGTPAAAPESVEQRGPCWQCRELVIVGSSKCRFCGAALSWPGNTGGPRPTSVPG